MSSAPLLRALNGERLEHPPIWFMRQAGRHLPEYREVRARAKGFLDFCFSPALATEATLQPVRRYGLDAAILFSDILTIPFALGQKVWFEEGVGPLLEPVEPGETARWSPAAMTTRLAPVYETAERVAGALPAETPLIGFAGGPWTVATYMLNGKGGSAPDAALWAYKDAAGLRAMLSFLAERTGEHLAAQVKAGARAIMIFESWSQGLAPALFESLVVEPLRQTAAAVRGAGCVAPLIVFPRGAPEWGYARVAEIVSPQGLGVDTSQRAALLHDRCPTVAAFQGNLDPLALIAGGEALDEAVDTVLGDFSARPHIFNLGHGVRPDTPIAHVEQTIRRVRGEG